MRLQSSFGDNPPKGHLSRISFQWNRAISAMITVIRDYVEILDKNQNSNCGVSVAGVRNRNPPGKSKQPGNNIAPRVDIRVTHFRNISETIVRLQEIWDTDFKFERATPPIVNPVTKSLCEILLELIKVVTIDAVRS